tara:strand:+ start:126 stop:524 length:399 start_codon:yes stop_codon:yes gene_type:complete
MNNNIDKAVRLLLDDNDFVDNIKNHINEISKDGKLDFTDTIAVVNLIIELIKNRNLYFDIDKNDISEVFRLIIIEILNEIKFIDILKKNSNLSDQEIEDKLDDIIEKLLNLIITQIKTTSFFKKLCKKIRCC